MAVMKQYPYGLDETLLFFEKYPWTIRDSFEGTAILGDMGSGKTTGSGATLAKAFLKAGYGGLVMCKKIDEVDTWVRYARETGRLDQSHQRRSVPVQLPPVPVHPRWGRRGLCG